MATQGFGVSEGAGAGVAGLTEGAVSVAVARCSIMLLPIQRSLKA